MGLIGMCCCSSKAATTHQIRLPLLQINTADQVTGAKALHLPSMVWPANEDLEGAEEVDVRGDTWDRCYALVAPWDKGFGLDTGGVGQNC